jgi:hypothetical protein
VLVVTTPAPDYSLLSIAELRSAAGVSDGSKDTDLLALGLDVAAAIARHCRIVSAGASPVTLRKETLTETIRFRTGPLLLGNTIQARQVRERDCLLLSRRPIVSIASITQDDTLLDPTQDYEIQSAAGLVLRLASDRIYTWVAEKIVVVYDAGWATVPGDLKRAAKMVVGSLWAAGTRDPNLKRIQIDGVSVREFWVGPATDPFIQNDVEDLLRPYTDIRV